MANCNCNLATVERECKSIAGMTPELHATCFDHIASIGAATDHVVSAITMRTTPSAGLFFKISTSRKDADFKSEFDPATGTWKTSGKFFVSKMNAARSKIFNSVGAELMVLVVKDNNGERRIIGGVDSVDIPCDVKVTEQVSPNGYMAEYEWESIHSPYYFTGSLAT